MEEEAWDIELFKENLRNLMSIIQRVVGRFCQTHWVLLRVYLQFFKDLAPYGLHGFPVSNYTMLDRITQLDETPIFFLKTDYHRNL